MRRMASPLLPVDEALARILAAGALMTETETVSLMEADGRVLSEDLKARLTQPPFDASAMDGYAVRIEDVQVAGAEVDIIGTSAAGAAWQGVIGRGKAVRILTGAPVPDGADAIVIQENTEKLGAVRLRITQAAAKGANIRRKGQDFTEGDVLLVAGQSLDFAALTLAAAMDHAVLQVLRKPRVAILATGDELVRPGEPRTPDQIVASSVYGVASLARQAGADVIDLGIARDDEAAIIAAVRRAEAEKADILVTLGGASVGDHDLIQPVLKSMGMTLDFWKIAMRPGKPLMVGHLNGMQVLGLPGNPVASLVCSILFLEPLIRHRASLGPINRLGQAVSAVDLPANDHRQDYMRAVLSDTNTVEPARKQDSAQVKILATSNCLIIRPPNAPPLGAGSPCPILRLRS